jgi:serine/threonine-protein kinase
VIAAAAQDTLIGSTLNGTYRVIRVIGRGGMGVVYEAEHVALGKRVAIKLVLEKYIEDGEAIKRFQREARAASRIGNPHIIDVQHIDHTPDGRPYVVMELLSGAPLSKVLEASGPLPVWRAIPMMKQVLRAVGAAHAKGIIHRDLKPDNIFLLDHEDNHDFIKLLDFGISKIMTDTTPGAIPTRLTTTGVVMGTPLYMAPEQAMGHPVDAQADLYACGVILYELLSGRPPFDATTYPVLIAQLLTAAPKPLGELVPGLPGNVVAAVHRALEKEPGNRFSTAEQFAAALGRDRTPSHMELGGTLDSAKSLSMAATQPTPAGGIPGTPRSTIRSSAPTQRREGPGLPMWAKAMLGAAGFAALAGISYLALRRDGSTGATASVPAAGVGSGSGSAAAAAIAPGSSAMTVTPLPTGSGTGSAAVQLPGTGILQIDRPTGASITVDNVVAGSVPRTVPVYAGRHHVVVSLPGYRPLETDADVTAGANMQIVLPDPIRLSPAPHPAPLHPPPPGAGPGRPSGPGTMLGSTPPPRPFPVIPHAPLDPYNSSSTSPVNPPTTTKAGDKPNPYQ